MKNKPLVSIIVPVYKAEKTIKRCVDSLIRQTYSNIEIILVENDSPDSSGKICDSFYDRRIVTLHSSKKGVSKARNIGLGVAKGDYLGFCDADDFYSKDYVQKILHASLATNADIVISGYYHEEEKSKFTVRSLDASQYINKNDVLKNILLTDIILGVCWNKLFKRSIIEDKYFPEDITILEDTYFLLEAMQCASSIYYLAEPLYYYCYNPKSAVRNIKTLFSEDHRDFMYVKSYNKIIHDFLLNRDDNLLIKSIIFEDAVWAKYLIVTHQYTSERPINNLNKEIKKNRWTFIKNKDLSVKKKAKVLIMLHFPWLKKLKDNISNSRL